MVEVTQGVQKCWFKYDSLGRLIRVRQPEQEVNTSLNLTDTFNTSGQWTTAFTYDVLGNVLTATDAKGTVITNTYDKAGRVITRTYSNEPVGITTPTVSFYYDGKGLLTPQSPNYAKGKLTKVTSSVSETQNTLFDNFGRLTETKQITDGQTYTSAYQYNLSGALVQETYPSGRVVKNEFEQDGDLMKVTSQKAGGNIFVPYVTNFLYTASGGISQMKLGNGAWESAKFNNRLQVTELGLGESATDTSKWKVAYEYGELQANGTVDSAKNTGNIARQTLSFSGLANPIAQAYKYDPLYRITEAKETANGTQNWIQNWNYDRYGNRAGFSQNIAGLTAAPNPTVDAYTNRFNSGQGFTYDKNGKVVSDVDAANNQTRSFVFNGDNKQTQVKDANGNTIGQYFYDGEGKRIKKYIATTGETTVFVYSSGKLVAEYSTTVASVEDAKIAYTTTDHLGSPRVITDKYGDVISRRDFLPFGEEVLPNVGARTSNLNYGSTDDGVRQKFTGYQKDSETSLDFAEARMYENRFGRFTAIDPLLASGKSANPQTFNRYVYVGNRPIGISDPRGLDWYHRTVDGRTVYEWSADNKTFKDGSSIEGWDQVDFRFSNFYYYNGCVDSECSSEKAAALYKGGGWDWKDSSSYEWHKFKDDTIRDFRTSWTAENLKRDWNYFSEDPLGERGLGNPGLAFVTGGLSQESQFLKGLRGAATEFGATTEAAKDAVQYEQYSLRAAADGMYPVFQRGSAKPVAEIFLKRGDVWKYGQTMRPGLRYTQKFLRESNLRYFTEFKTTSFKEVIQTERFKILEFKLNFGSLPAGNKIIK